MNQMYCPPGSSPFTGWKGYWWWEGPNERITRLEKQVAVLAETVGKLTANMGVTDGSAARPGQVGEVFIFEGTSSFPPAATQYVQLTNIGTLPAGDWDVQAWLEVDVPVLFGQLDNIPSTDLGLDDAQVDALIPKGWGYLSVELNTASGGNQFVLPTFVTLAQTAQPTPLIMRTIINASAAQGTCGIGMLARRVR